MNESTQYEDPINTTAVTAAMKGALVGRRIVKAEKALLETEWHSQADGGVLTLDDGAKLNIIPNRGCGGCSSGWFGLDDITAFDNVITNVELADDQGDSLDVDWEVRANATLTITVYAEGASATVATITGSEGNGYYGRGYSFRVVPA